MNEDKCELYVVRVESYSNLLVKNSLQKGMLKCNFLLLKLIH